MGVKLQPFYYRVVRKQLEAVMEYDWTIDDVIIWLCDMEERGQKIDA